MFILSLQRVQHFNKFTTITGLPLFNMNNGFSMTFWFHYIYSWDENFFLSDIVNAMSCDIHCERHVVWHTLWTPCRVTYIVNAMSCDIHCERQCMSHDMAFTMYVTRHGVHNVRHTTWRSQCSDVHCERHVVWCTLWTPCRVTYI
jgi:hypothetical protein